MYHQQCHFSNVARIPTDDDHGVQTHNVDASSTEMKFPILRKEKESNPRNQNNDAIWVQVEREEKNQHINPNRYGYVQAANSLLKTINTNLKDIKNWVILD